MVINIIQLFTIHLKTEEAEDESMCVKVFFRKKALESVFQLSMARKCMKSFLF